MWKLVVTCRFAINVINIIMPLTVRDFDGRFFPTTGLGNVDLDSCLIVVPSWPP